MGFRFRKSINLGGGVKLNVSKKGIGISAGVKGLRISHGADGKTRLTASIPGTGISYQETLNKREKMVEDRFHSDIDSDTPIMAFQGLYYGEFDKGVLEVEFDGSSLHKPCSVTFYQEYIYLEVKGLLEKQTYFKFDTLKLEKRVKSSGLFWGVKEIFLAFVSTTQFSVRQLIIKVPNNDSAKDIMSKFTTKQRNLNRR